MRRVQACPTVVVNLTADELTLFGIHADAAGGIGLEFARATTRTARIARTLRHTDLVWGFIAENFFTHDDFL
jgi:hypothetical protein